MKNTSTTLLLVLATLSLPCFADNGIEIHQPWARASAPGAPAAGFMMILNRTGSADTLLDVSGSFARRIELHQSLSVDGLMKMVHQRAGVRIPAGDELVLKPGSYHLMFMGLARPFGVGETYGVTLRFEQAGVIEVLLPVVAVEHGHDMAH
ncbi:copper chaperone PCu(A)C [Reinekea sp.]|uniref:copper chaperone PCu(A)C n=1 Tax=Reinekea sp. TaxID=1970455 RepID=UPI002A7F642F|nr:copper chaperone PCu(A)C [Reinekea sp.]